jgi:predicted transcriptional regulator
MVRESRESAEAEAASFLQEVTRGVASAEAGRLIPYEAVRRWILSWGSDTELDQPQCK